MEFKENTIEFKENVQQKDENNMEINEDKAETNEDVIEIAEEAIGNEENTFGIEEDIDESEKNTAETDESPIAVEKGVFSFLGEISQWLLAILIALLVALLLRGFVFEIVMVDGTSMKDTLETGQRLIVNKLVYNFYAPKRGDIIVLQYQEGMIKNIPFIGNSAILKKFFPDLKETDYVKRVIGLPGDEVDIRDDGFVYINGKKLIEPYAKGMTYKHALKFPLTVPEKKVLVLGDNRTVSNDSRQIGFIDYSKIKGKAAFRVWPFDKAGSIYKLITTENNKMNKSDSNS